MPIRAQSSDGKIHEFPDGTADAVIDRAMKSYAAELSRTAASLGTAAAGAGAAGILKAREKPMGAGEYMAGLAANAVQGATLGFGDELAGVSAGMVGAIPRLAGVEGAPTYESGRDTFRAVRNDFAERRPVAATVANIAGAIPTALALPVGATAGALSLPARIGRGLAVGGSYGAVTGFGEGEGGAGNRIENAALYGGIGAAGGGLLEAVIPKIGGALGLNRPVTPAIRQQADALPVPVPLSVGQATDDVGRLGREFALARGAEGERAMGVMRDFSRSQDDALRANVDAIKGRLAGGNPVIERGDGGRIVSDRLSSMADDAKGRAGALYDKAREASEGVSLMGDFGKGVAQRMATRVTTDHAPENVPKVVREIERLNAYGEKGDVPARVLFEARARLNGAKSGGGEDAVAAGKAVKELDAAIDDALQMSLLSGDEAGITAWRDAIANYKDFARTFKSNDLVGRLVARDPKQGFALAVKPEDAANYLFNWSRLGLNRRDLISGLGKLKSTLGENTPEFNALQQEYFARLADSAMGAQGPTGRAFSGAKLASAWEDPQNQLVAKVLLPADVRRDIGNWVNVARRVTTKDPAVYAPSTSPLQMRKLAQLAARLPSMLPVVGPWLRGLETIAADEIGAAAARKAISGVLPQTGPTGGAATAITGIGAPRAIENRR